MKRTLTGRTPTQPQLQTLPRPLSLADRELCDRLRAAMRRKPAYMGIPSATSATSYKHF